MTGPGVLATRLPSGFRLRRVTDAYGQELLIIAAIILLFIVVGTLKPRFLNDANLISIFSGNAYIAVAAIGMSMLIISGNLDVSIGALIGVLATISGVMAVSGFPIWLCWTVPVLVGVVVDAGVGVLVAYARIPSIVVTLGMLSILKGGLISATGGLWIQGMPPEYFISQMQFLGIPLPLYFMVILTGLAAIWMRDFGFRSFDLRSRRQS